jgi:hypothetical protein
VQGRRLRIPTRLGRGQPTFRCVERPASQEIALVTIGPLPLERATQQARVLFDPIDISLERLHELLHGPDEVVVVARDDPVALGDPWRKRRRVDVPAEQRNDLLAHRQSVLEVAQALL